MKFLWLLILFQICLVAFSVTIIPVKENLRKDQRVYHSNDIEFSDAGNLINIAKAAMELRKKAAQAVEEIKKEVDQMKKEVQQIKNETLSMIHNK